MKNIYLIVSIIIMFVLNTRGQNKLNLQVDEAKTKINKEIYGHFAEHLGHCIYGGIFVGENSNIPNERGFRTDVINALKEMQIPLLRWPGGCFADTYHWKDGIGSREKRPSIVNIHWGGVTEDNSFGTHEFLDFCELIDAEPYININVGSGTVQEASEWVEYVTSGNESPMTQLRKENGREDPWEVKYWGIGNENWGCGGNMTPEYYSDLYNRFATYCGGAKYKIAGGPNVADYNWMRVVMQKVASRPWLVQGVSLHNYSFAHNWDNKGDATGFAEDEWFSNLKDVHRMSGLIKQHTAIMDQYDQERRIGLIVDEWGNWFQVEKGTNPGFLYQQNTIRDALAASINLNIFNNHAERVKMANIAQMVNVLQSVILTKGDKMVLTPTYYIFKMYGVHQDAMLIPSHLKTEDYEYKGEKIPAINASASIKEGVVNITLSNASANKDVILEIDVNGKEVKTATGQIITSKNINDYNDFDKPEAVSLSEYKVAKPEKGKLTVTIPAHSVLLVQLK
ncbi:MAG TPA: alpha-N-arabinofuranosidase [Marinilabiliales bacterium]|jgi:alpha-N-arabinofuranosidase|nr:alpha-N-arabinofuranosidase [Marinilabiliales bacterium]HAZ01046.1 alpha-N-arabinofuranosidase [Marinilabiliales bacterium]HBO73741.1 alpha-N-arabinofuranosidase [Marinilabiliales bacterium]HBX86193.1 alpha-N-arabinofuranosidase [Marinilabiliales bacterium]HBY51909.1 alpha-N-arabinofuranosidase [Marinilabiliales bacterium]